MRFAGPSGGIHADAVQAPVQIQAVAVQPRCSLPGEIGVVSGRRLCRAGGAASADYVALEGKPLAWIATAAICWVHADHPGTPQMLTDAAGAAVWDATYRPFGEATVTGALTFNLRFPGQYEDAETGLHYNANRDYDPATGRYIQSDPIGLQGGWNTFAYVGGNPMMGVDKLGLVNEENLQEITNPGIKEDVRKAIYDAEKKIIVCQSNENCPYNTDEEFKNIIIEMMHKAHYHFDDALGGCAEMAHRQGSKSREELALVWLGPAAWVTDDCCTLASTVAHEAIHNAFARRGNTNYDSQEPYITQVEKVCFGC